MRESCPKWIGLPQFAVVLFLHANSTWQAQNTAVLLKRILHLSACKIVFVSGNLVLDRGNQASATKTMSTVK